MKVNKLFFFFTSIIQFKLEVLSQNIHSEPLFCLYFGSGKGKMVILTHFIMKPRLCTQSSCVKVRGVDFYKIDSEI